MPHKNYPDTLYLIKQPSSKFGVTHYGILDIGNVLNLENYQIDHPIVIHQTPPEIRLDWLQDTGRWEVEGWVERSHLPHAIQRVQIAIQNKDYQFFSNNCEQFARFIVEGAAYSTQLQAVGVILALVTLPILFSDE